MQSHLYDLRVNPTTAFMMKRFYFDVSESEFLCNRDGSWIRNIGNIQNDEYERLELAYQPTLRQALQCLKKFCKSLTVDFQNIDGWVWIAELNGKQYKSTQTFTTPEDVINDLLIELMIFM